MSCLHEFEMLEMRADTPADRRRMRDVIDLALRLEKLSASRLMLVGLLALLGGPLWILAVWPDAMPHWRMFFIAGWLLGSVILGAVTLAETAARRRLRHLASCPMAGADALQAATRPSA